MKKRRKKELNYFFSKSSFRWQSRRFYLFLKRNFIFFFRFYKKRAQRKIEIFKVYLIVFKSKFKNWIGLKLKDSKKKRIISRARRRRKKQKGFSIPSFLSGEQLKAVFFNHPRTFWVLIVLGGILLMFYIFQNFGQPTFQQKERAKDYYQEAIYFLDKGETQKAEEYFRKAYKENPYNPLYLWQLAITQKENQKYQEAIKSYNKLIKMLPDKPIIYFQKGEIYEMLGQKEKAEEFYQKAKKLSKFK